MSHTSRIFEEAPIKVQNRNGFDLSHLHVGSAYCGQLKPCLCKLLPPNTDFSLGVAMQVELPPLATSFFGRIDAIVEGFVVPCSILYGGWKKFIMNNASTANNGSTKFGIPYWNPVTYVADGLYTGSGIITSNISQNKDILDTLGYTISEDLTVWPLVAGGGDFEGPNLSLLPFLAYHLIWDTFYRNKNVTRSCFDINADVETVADPNVSRVWHSYYKEGSSDVDFTSMDWQTETLMFADNKYLWQTRQRNYARDYFTAASVKPQQGDAVSLKFDVNVDSSDLEADGSFTIASLRNANALQKFLETNNLSQDYSDLIRNRWGGKPIDADFDEPYYLGRCVVPVYQKSVYQTVNNQSASSTSTATNPFSKAGILGSKAASGSFVGNGSICQRFHNSTWAYVMGIFSLVPHAMYSQGLNKELSYIQIGDFPAPELQSTGYDAIGTRELYFDATSLSRPDFAYIPRYSSFKYMNDEVTGELKADRTLDSFVLQRSFGSVPSFGTSFLEIGISDLDDVLAVTSNNMKFSCWYEIFWEFKVVMPLSVFAVPTLGELQDTHTQKVTIGGSRL